MQTFTGSSRSGPDARIRAVFLDIDGTLVGRNHTVSAGVVEAVGRARQHGCEIVLCTGRARVTTFPIAEQLGPPLGYAVTSNGGVLSHLGTGVILYRRLLPIPVALEALRMIRAAGADPYAYEDSDTEGVEGARVLYHPDTDTSAWDHRDPRYRPYADLLADLPFQPVSISTYGPPDTIRPIAAHLRERLGDSVSIIESGTELAWGVEIYVRGISKRTGLEAVAARLEAGREEIMAIGDHMNDLDMLEWAGWGVAMGNAQPEVKAIADWVTDSVAADGVARAIERFVLGARQPEEATRP